MNHIRYGPQVCILLLMLFLPFLNLSAAAFSQPATLRGLKAVSVLISEIPREIKDIGLQEQMLYDDVVSVLAETSIRVNTQRYQIAGDPDLLVDVFGGELIQGVITYCIDVRLDQPVVLERDQRIRSNATTWSQKFIGVAGYGTKPEVIRNQVKELLRVFVHDYRVENPKKNLDDPDLTVE